MNTFSKAYFYRKIVMAKLYIDQHFAEDIDVDNIASEAHFSKFDFIRQFKKVYQKTPYHYLKSLRIKKAKALLEAGYSVRETCFAVGYGSLSSFSGLFKKETHQTPSAYQQAFIERSQHIQRQPLDYVPGCFSGKYGWKKEQF